MSEGQAAEALQQLEIIYDGHCPVCPILVQMRKALLFILGRKQIE
ncbi:MAG: hypothetical protein AAGI11_13715 [Pseudomonadota bacterium]